MSEKFNLHWNDFQSNITKTFSNLRGEDDFYDVTLVTDDQHQVSAHKVVLSSCSQYFKTILRQNKHSHPLLCLEGVNTDQLNKMLDYIYHGEVQICQDNLEQFLGTAQRFQLQGLIDSEMKAGFDEQRSNEKTLKVEDYDPPKDIMKPKNHERKPKEKVVSVIANDMDGLEEKIEKLIDRNSDGKFRCITCDKISSRRRDASEHAETHIEGLSFPCQLCDKSFRYRTSLRRHKCLQ